MANTPITPWGQAAVGSQAGYENWLGQPADPGYEYTFGDWITGKLSSAKQAEMQSRLDAKEWLRNEYSAAQQRAFEEYMDSTKTQRAMKDIQAAGLNPWLALQSAGFGGSVPSGAAATSSAGQVANNSNSPGTSFGSTALGLAMLIKTIAKIVK